MTPTLKKLEVAGRFHDDDFCSADVQAEVDVEHRMIDRKATVIEHDDPNLCNFQ